MTNVDRALLLAEWCQDDERGDKCCPACHWFLHDAKEPGVHRPGCVMDLALAERGFATRDDRDRARTFLAANRETLPPPEENR